MPGEEPKLIIDSDWKNQAQAEKDRLEQAAAAKKAKSPAAGIAGGGVEGETEGEEGPAGFKDLVAMFATQAMSYMGYFPDPRTGQAVVALDYAKINIDMLGILEEKTKGNLTEEESAFMQRTVGELRMAFVELSKAVAKAVQEGRIKPGQMGGPGVGGGGVVTPGAMSPKLNLGGTT
jgi:Domain of unknown function (DUF1844)